MGQQTAAGPTFLDTLPMLAVPILIFYFIVFRPQMKTRKEHEQMLKQIKKNDEVATTGGLIGTVVNVKADTVTLRVDENVRIEVERSAIVRVLKDRAGSGEAAPAEKKS